MKRLLAGFCLLLLTASAGTAGECEDRFSELLINGNPDQGPVRIHITQEIVGGHEIDGGAGHPDHRDRRGSGL